MKDLIEALTIFARYRDVRNPTNCAHDVLCIMAVERDEVSAADRARLDALGFFWSGEHDCWASFRFGSA
jgi:hypothetical protein